MDTTIIEENERLIRARQNHPVIKVTQNQFMALMEQNVGGVGFATIHATTSYVPGKSSTTKKHRTTKVPAEDCFCWPITKGYNINFPLGAQYESVVNRQREREGTEKDFESVGYVNGMVPLNKFFCQNERTGRIHMRVTIPSAMPNAFGEAIYKDANGNLLNEEAVTDLKENFLAKKGKSRQGVEDEVKHLTPLLNNIQFAVVGGVLYEILSSEPTE